MSLTIVNEEKPVTPSIAQRVLAELTETHGKLSFVGHIPINIFGDILKMYDKHLDGKLTKYSKRAKMNFKFVPRGSLKNPYQLSYWTINKERVTPENPYPNSFIIHVSMKLWAKTVNLFVNESYGRRMHYDMSVSKSDHSVMAMLHFIEHYMSSFFTVVDIGKGATHNKFMHRRQRIHSDLFSMTTAWSDFKTVCYNKTSGELGQRMFEEDDRVVLWTTGAMVAWDVRETSPVRIDLFQSTYI